MIEQAQQEKEEFDRILRVQREAEELEKVDKTKRMEAAYGHMTELQAQILMNAEVRKKNRMDFLNESSKDCKARQLRSPADVYNFALQ